MLIRFFKSNQPAALFAVPVLVSALWISSFFHTNIPTISGAMPLYQLLLYLLELINGNIPTVHLLIGIALTSFQAIYLGQICNKFDVLYKKSYLPALLYAILISSVPSFLSMTPMLVANTILLLLIEKIFSIYKHESALHVVFDAGFLVALASLVYFPLIAIFVLLILGLLILRPFVWREWVAGITGTALPYFILSVYFFWNGQLGNFWTKEIPLYFDHAITSHISTNTSNLFLFSMVAFLILIAFLKLQANFYKNMIRTRSYQQVFLLMLIVAGGSSVISPEIKIESFIPAVAPAAVFISYYFLSVKKTWWIETLFSILIALIVWNQVTS